MTELATSRWSRRASGKHVRSNSGANSPSHESKSESTGRYIRAAFLSTMLFAVADPVLGAGKVDILGVSIGSTPEQVSQKFSSCTKQQERGSDARTYLCRMPDGELRVSFLSPLSASKAYQISYRFSSDKDLLGLEQSIMRQYGLGPGYGKCIGGCKFWDLESGKLGIQSALIESIWVLTLANEAMKQADLKALRSHRQELDRTRTQSAPDPRF